MALFSFKTHKNLLCSFSFEFRIEFISSQQKTFPNPRILRIIICFIKNSEHSEAFRMQTNFSCLGKDLPALVELDESATCILGCIFGGDFDFAWMVLRILGVLSCV